MAADLQVLIATQRKAILRDMHDLEEPKISSSHYKLLKEMIEFLCAGPD